MTNTTKKIRERDIRNTAARILDRVELLIDAWPTLSQGARKEALKRFEEYTAAEIRLRIPCIHG